IALLSCVALVGTNARPARLLGCSALSGVVALLSRVALVGPIASPARLLDGAALSGAIALLGAAAPLNGATFRGAPAWRLLTGRRRWLASTRGLVSRL